jgi:glycosyltransferase involved in cell wall biosynthesis
MYGRIPRKVKSIALIGTCVPRKCGIATFTDDLSRALEEECAGDCRIDVVAMDDIDGGYAYPPRVKFQIRDNSLTDYLRAAEFLNTNQTNIVILQHEYGIFGGKIGCHILHLVKNLKMPLITTLHTVLTEPSDEQRAILLELADYSEQLAVMSKKAVQILRDTYGIPEKKVTYIPHGIPDFAFEDPSYYKDLFGVENRTLLLSFGLVHPGKGYEVVIQALPEVIQSHPEVIYIILGVTHPHIIRGSGDVYRHSLHQLVHRLGLESFVRFDNKFVDLPELCQYISAADIFITPYVSPVQISSGTLSYAVGAGKAVISTPYWYAEELLAEGRGVLVPFGDVKAMARAINNLLDNVQERNAMRKRAYEYGRRMTWKEVARRYLDLCSRVLERPRSRVKATSRQRSPARIVEALPVPNLQHLRVMTDDTGILQHCTCTIPNRDHGYCVDDQARALIVTSLYYALYRDKQVIPLTQRYLAFLFHAFNRENGRFRNFMSYDRKWLEEAGSEDAHGRALWGLGVAVREAPTDSIRAMATRLFKDGLPALEDFTFLRSWAFALVGIHAYLEVYHGDAEVRRVRRQLTEKLYQSFKHCRPDWFWPEDVVTYDNAKLPHALLLAGRHLSDPQIFDTGLAALNWLLKQQTAPEGHLTIVGNDGWMTRTGYRARFDQQPVDAMALVDACLEAFRGTGEFMWVEEARRCLNWFLGYNDLNLPLYDFTTGGCCDGLTPHGVNANQGAESTLSWLIALLTMYEVIGHEVLINGNGRQAINY